MSFWELVDREARALKHAMCGATKFFVVMEELPLLLPLPHGNGHRDKLAHT
jgi:hypothetical protein